MSLKKSKRIEPAREYEFTESVTCDICGKEHKGAQADGEGVNWGGGHDDIDATGVYMKTGYNCPSGGSQETTQYHVCPPCMRDKVFPAVKELAGGKEPGPVYEVDW